MQNTVKAVWKLSLSAAVFIALPISLSSAQTLGKSVIPNPLPPGVEKIGSIIFDKDTIRPARVEDSAVSTIEEVVKRLKNAPDKKLVLVGQTDLKKDTSAQNRGMEREEEDATGRDVRWEDLAAYRALNTKWYIATYYHVDPSRILPTTDDYIDGQTVTFYLVPDTADYNHNFLGTTKTNEKPCTVKPCYTPDEETLSAQPRSRISTLRKTTQ